MELLGMPVLRAVFVVLVPFTLGRFLENRKIIAFTRYDFFIGILFFGTLLDMVLNCLAFETGIPTLMVIGFGHLVYFWFDKKHLPWQKHSEPIASCL